VTRIWKEKLDTSKHHDFMTQIMPNRATGGYKVQAPQDNLNEHWVYFVRVCSFTFEFHSLAQIHECLAYFSRKLRPNRLIHIEFGERWIPWYERLPQWLFEESKRQRVVKALQQAIDEFN
jgi:hypothetical protein